MALTATTLARAHSILNGQDSKVMTLTSATGATTQMIAYIDGLECVRITDVSLTPTLGIVPGYTASTGGPHAVGAPVVFGLPIDFPPIGGPFSMSINVSGAIVGPGGVGTLPVSDMLYFLTTAGVGVFTIAAPNAGQTNTLTFVSTTANAHTLTMTGNPAATDTATFANVGSSLTIRALNGAWDVLAVGGGTAVA